MDKEELIALSDLNKEDNIKYISSEAQGIAITLNSDKYAPTLCKLERAYICGRRKSEEQIEQLKKENAGLKKRNIEDCKNFNRAVEKIGEQLNQKQYQLTKAKELLKWWVNHCGDHDLFYAEKTEQFLKDVEDE